MNNFCFIFLEFVSFGDELNEKRTLMNEKNTSKRTFRTKTYQIEPNNDYITIPIPILNNNFK